MAEPVSLFETYTLQRGRSGPFGTFGTLRKDGKLVCQTLERPWNENKPKISSIPAGRYKVIRHGWENNSPVKFKQVWQLCGVPNRSNILIHAGNTISDTEGCILVGRGVMEDTITDSRAAVALLRATLPETFFIEIRDAV